MMLRATPTVALLCLAAGCPAPLSAPTRSPPSPSPSPSLAPTAAKVAPGESPEAFIARTNEELKALWAEASRANWVKETFITDDTEQLAAEASEKVMAYTTRAIDETRAFSAASLEPEVARQIHLLKVSTSLPAPAYAPSRQELARISSKMTSAYGKGRWCPAGKTDAAACEDLEELSRVMAKSRDAKALVDAWTRWRSIAPAMRAEYARFVELGNEGAREIGFDDLGLLWRSRYDMSPAEFGAMTDALWQQVAPLYEQLHCYVRDRLADRYPGVVAKSGTIPAHVLGNMWAQSWGNVYDLVEPYPGVASLDVTRALEQKQWTPRQLVELGEGFFVSLGLKPLPDSFWQRSMFEKPKDHDVVCHASAWDITYAGDARLKMCIERTEEDLITVHHELGHIYYFLYYHQLPALYQDGANDGFHEAMGDAIALSITPSYLKDRGVLEDASEDERALLNVQMRDALDKVAFLPFGRLVDRWRWDVFAGRTKPADYNAAWWTLRASLQGIHPPVPRSEADFDPGAKFHIPANVPYARYFLAHILQFQFHRALCDAAGHTGPLHTCSIYGSKKAGARLTKVLEMGASRPWPDALEALTGSREMDASALLDYFAPLSKFLAEQNAGAKCGW
jgi:peptidyl-dipeptidase A